MQRYLFILIIYVSSPNLCITHFLKPNEISDIQESFVLRDIEYIMLNVRVTWEEAVIVCQSFKNGSLAIVNTYQIAKFLGEALSETNLEMEDLWIGARKEGNEAGYVWLNDKGVYLEDENFINRGQENFNISRDCLSIARKYHLIPEYINLECDLKRPLICEKPYEKIINGSMTIPDWITIGKYQYGIFYDEKTWVESARECQRKHNAHLASFRNAEEVNTVGKFLLIGRPSLENAWIGIYYTKGNWKVLHTGEILPNKMDNETQFPPWRQNRTLKHAGCVLLDRHIADKPVFLESRCQRRRSYVCSKTTYKPDYQIVVINDTGYVIYYIKKNWDDAEIQCNSHNASLVKVLKKNIHDVTFIMGENFTEINHIWIGGRLTKNGENFVWVRNNEPIPPNNVNPNHYPPWYDNVYSQKYACLNMDRENHNRPLFYGVNCEVPQEFICEQKNLDLLPEQPNALIGSRYKSLKVVPSRS